MKSLIFLLALASRAETINLVVTNSSTIVINVIVAPVAPAKSNLVGQATSAGEFVKGNDGNWYEKTSIVERFNNFDGTETAITRQSFKKVDEAFISTIPMRKVNGALTQPIPPMPASTNRIFRVTQLAEPAPALPPTKTKMLKFYEQGGQKSRPIPNSISPMPKIEGPK